MSADSQWSVQQMIYDRLRLDSSFTELLSAGAESIFDHVPVNAAMPCCVIAEMSAESFDTQTKTGFRILCAIETYSRMPGSQELKKLSARIYDLLHFADLSTAEHEIILCRLKSTRSEVLQAGQLRKNRQIFEIITEPKSP